VPGLRLPLRAGIPTSLLSLSLLSLTLCCLALQPFSRKSPSLLPSFHWSCLHLRPVAASPVTLFP
jgi:hypothetical protein